MSFDLKPFEKYVETVRSRATAERYSIAVTAFLHWVRESQGEGPLSGLREDTLSAYAVSLLDRGYLPGTVMSHLAGVKRYLRWLQEKQGVQLPKFHRAELPKRKRKIRDVLSADMLKHYFRVAEELHEPLRTAAKLLPCSGLRSHEMVGLPMSRIRRSDFEMADGRKSMLCFSIVGKGGNERIVPLFDEGAEILLEYLKTWRAEHTDEMYLFPGRYSGHLSTRGLRESVQKIRSAFSGVDWSPHTMRRTYLTTLYRRGVPIPTLAKIGGHSVDVLIEYYLVLDEHDVVGAVQTAGPRLM